MPKYVAYLAVLPAYRRACIEILLDELGGDVELYASSAHLDTSVRTGISSAQYIEIAIRRYGKSLFLQTGHWLTVIRAESAILDLNPRSLSAWLLLLVRSALRRRSLVWGHLYPRAGRASRSAVLRRVMRKLASGTLTYTYEQAQQAASELPSQPVWVAPNALYRREAIGLTANSSDRNDLLYVGRLECAKKVVVLMSAFAEHASRNPGTRLVLVGSGSEESALRTQAAHARVASRVSFLGEVHGTAALKELYKSAFASCSPGFAGLGLTQSLGFGVPQIISRDEPHSPEIELAGQPGAVRWFQTDDVRDFANVIDDAYSQRATIPNGQVSAHIAKYYSAEAMAAGIADGFQGCNAYQNEVTR